MDTSLLAEVSFKKEKVTFFRLTQCCTLPSINTNPIPRVLYRIYFNMIFISKQDTVLQFRVTKLIEKIITAGAVCAVIHNTSQTPSTDKCLKGNLWCQAEKWKLPTLCFPFILQVSTSGCLDFHVSFCKDQVKRKSIRTPETAMCLIFNVRVEFGKQAAGQRFKRCKCLPCG